VQIGAADICRYGLDVAVDRLSRRIAEGLKVYLLNSTLSRSTTLRLELETICKLAYPIGFNFLVVSETRCRKCTLSIKIADTPESDGGSYSTDTIKFCFRTVVRTFDQGSTCGPHTAVHGNPASIGASAAIRAPYLVAWTGVVLEL
jgi:hypothetical protein